MTEAELKQKRQEIREGIAHIKLKRQKIETIIQQAYITASTSKKRPSYYFAQELMQSLNPYLVILNPDKPLPKLIDRFRGQVKRVLIQAGFSGWEPLIPDSLCKGYREEGGK